MATQCFPSPHVATRVFCVTLNAQFFQMFGADSRAMGRFLDVVCYGLSVAKGVGLLFLS